MNQSRETPFDKYRFNHFSQNGEDGVISEILNRLQLDQFRDRFVVEFGAWDGIHCSNTYHLVRQGWQAIYIEGDINRFKELLITADKHKNIQPVCEFVDSNPHSSKSLDAILKKTPVPKDFDLLSIDIDSLDLDVWESLSGYAPIIVVIEINSGLPPGIFYRHSDHTPGNTFSSTLCVGLDKGYQLVCHTGNMIFVRKEYLSKLNIPEKFLKFPELLFDYSHSINLYIKKDSFLIRFKTWIKFILGK